jgi:hypothetical protein
MAVKIQSQYYTDEQGNPAGGKTTGQGIQIQWQAGPLVRDGVRQQPNGAFVEDVIAAALDRLEYHQGSKFACPENALAITKLQEGLFWLQHRTRQRQERQVEGTHEV